VKGRRWKIRASLGKHRRRPLLTAPTNCLAFTCGPERHALQLENPALRHQIGVLQRSAAKRSKLTVKPETVIAWHRAGFRLFWTWKDGQRRAPVAPQAGQADPQQAVHWCGTANQPPEMGSVVAVPHVGGLHHRYERQAA
jgi:hypothetical protein